MEAGHSHNAWATPPAPHAGQKRKWEDRSQHIRPTAFTSPPAKPQQGSKPPRAKAAVAPAVPSFGFSLPTLPGPSTAAKASNSSGKDVHKKGKIRLGLTNQPPPEEASSEEESGDEEATLGAKINGGGYAFEHEGQQIALQTEADIAAWIKDRRRNFPTRQKASEKAEAAAMRRKHELDFIRKLKGKPPRSEHIEVRQERQQHPAKPKQDTKKQEELAALRKKLHESMLEKRDAPRAVDLGLGYASETESDRESSILSESSVVSSSEESDEDEEEDENDSDAAPEPISAKIAPPPVKVPPPVSTATQNQPASETAGVCFKFQRDGRCPRGRNCRFKHTPREDMHEKRTTLFEKMVEQELLKSDQLALDAIKYLGQNGYLG